MWQIINNCLVNLMLLTSLFIFGKIVLAEKAKISKKKLLLTIFVFIITYTIILFKCTGTTKTLIMTVLNIGFFKKMFEITNKKAVLLTVMCMIGLIVTELLELIFITEVLGISKEFCYNTYAGSLASNFFMYSIFVAIVFMLRKGLKKFVNQKLENNKKIIVLSMLTSMCVLLFFYEIVKEIRLSNNIILYLIAIIVLLFVLFSLIKKTIENNKLTTEYDKLMEFMITYENEIENQRILRHEIKNEFRTIRAKICDQQNNKEIIEYIDEIVNDKYEMNKEKYAKFGYLPPNGTKGLCYFKTQSAEDKGIKVSLNISKRIKESTIYNLTLKEQRDFGRILGVFLDNAIEASEESKEKQIGIEAYINSEKEFRMIITNTYKNKIDKSKIGLESFSTKGKTRGHGLLLVKQLVGKNKKFEIKTDIKENIYIQTIEIKKL